MFRKPNPFPSSGEAIAVTSTELCQKRQLHWLYNSWQAVNRLNCVPLIILTLWTFLFIACWQNVILDASIEADNWSCPVQLPVWSIRKCLLILLPERGFGHSYRKTATCSDIIHRPRTPNLECQTGCTNVITQKKFLSPLKSNGYYMYHQV